MTSSIPASFQSKIKVLETGGFNPNRVRGLFYGDSGVGKTVFASTWPTPLFLNVDDGLASVSLPGIASWDIFSWEDAFDAVSTLLHTPEIPFETIVLDSTNELQKMAMAYTIQTYPQKRAYGSQPILADYGKSFDEFEAMVRNLKSLPVNVVFLSQVKDRAMDTDTVGPLFSGKNTSPNICRMMDIIGYIYKGDSSEGRQPRSIAFDIPGYVTKDRSGLLPPIHNIRIKNEAYHEIRAYWTTEEK